MCKRMGLLAITLLAATAVQAQERRELGAHEHGHSVLNIAIEGTTLAMELIAPGVDIVGFEHPATTDADVAAVEAAREALANPLSLFVMTPEADCRLTMAAVKLEAEEHHEEHAEAEHHAEGEAEEEGHNQFHAEYAIDCAQPDALDAIAFDYFGKFANAEEVEVTIVTDRGQTAFEVARDAPRISLGGLM